MCRSFINSIHPIQASIAPLIGARMKPFLYDVVGLRYSPDLFYIYPICETNRRWVTKKNHIRYKGGWTQSGRPDSTYQMLLVLNSPSVLPQLRTRLTATHEQCVLNVTDFNFILVKSCNWKNATFHTVFFHLVSGYCLQLAKYSNIIL